jgi:hypothetical protein
LKAKDNTVKPHRDEVHPATITITPARAMSANMLYFFIFPSPTEVYGEQML